jgi:hypothetical protein
MSFPRGTLVSDSYQRLPLFPVTQIIYGIKEKLFAVIIIS